MSLLRKCLIHSVINVEGTTQQVHCQREAYFHGFGTDFYESVDGQRTCFTCALIELADSHTLAMVHPTNVTFNDCPEEEAKNVTDANH